MTRIELTKRLALTLAAVGALAVAGSSASAADRITGPSHAELGHRSYHRAVTHVLAHRLGISHYQDHRLHSALRHEAVHDRVEHQASHSPAPVYRYAAPVYRSPAPSYRHVPVSRHVSPSYGHQRYSHGRHGVSISTRGFSLFFGH